jgi:hypothetical protein
MYICVYYIKNMCTCIYVCIILKICVCVYVCIILKICVRVYYIKNMRTCIYVYVINQFSKIWSKPNYIYYRLNEHHYIL